MRWLNDNKPTHPPLFKMPARMEPEKAGAVHVSQVQTQGYGGR